MKNGQPLDSQAKRCATAETSVATMKNSSKTDGIKKINASFFATAEYNK
jgi:hypothetical protein